MWASGKLVAVLGLLLVSFVNSAPLHNHSPIDTAVIDGQVKCPGICADSKNFNYQVGKSYVYDFKSITKFGNDDDTKELSETELTISGQAKIIVESKCEHQIKLEHVSIQGLAKAKVDELIQQLEKHSTAYFFNDGAIPSVCPLKDESDWAVNVKRAVLSALQVSVVQPLDQLTAPKLVSETDVLGQCDTQYELVERKNDLLQLTKRKMLGTCTQRVHLISMLQGGNALGELFLRGLSSAGLHQHHNCHQQLKPAEILLTASCSGISDADQMFSDGFAFNSSMSIKFNNEQPISYPPLNGPHRIQSLLGQALPHEGQDSKQMQQVSSLPDAVKELCKALIVETLNENTADQFDSLVESVRTSNYETLNGEFQRLLASRNHALAKPKDHEKQMKSDCCPHRLFKLFIDSLYSAKTEESMRLQIEQLVPFHYYLEPNYWRSKFRLTAFYTSLGFHPKPTEGMLQIAQPLLKKGQPYPRHALLGVSALVASYSKAYPEKANSPMVQKLAEEIASGLGSSCIGKSDVEQADISNRLHALQNFRQLPDKVIDLLLECAQNTQTPLGARVAALSAAHRRHVTNANEKLGQVASKLLFDKKQPDELRITAYKAIIRFIDGSKQQEQLQALIQEGGEISSYIASHVLGLRNIPEIHCPILKKYLEQVDHLRGLEQAALSGRSRRTTLNPQLGYIFRDQLKVKLELITDNRGEQSWSVKACTILGHSKLLSVAVRQTLGGASAGNVQQLTDASQAVLQSLLSGGEQLQQRLEQALPQLQQALFGSELVVKLDGKLIYYRSSNEPQDDAAFAQLAANVQFGLSELFGQQKTLSMQVQGFSGVPSTYTLSRTELFRFPQILSDDLNQDGQTFDILPNLVVRSEMIHRIAVANEHHTVAQLRRRSYLSSGFSINAHLKKENDGWQLRIRLPADKVELFQYRIQTQLQRPGVQSQQLTLPTTYQPAEICIDHFVPLKQLLGMSLCVKSTNGLRRVLLTQEPGSSLLISDMPIKDDGPNGSGRRYTLRLENGGKPRELTYERRHSKSKTQNTLSAKSPLLNANAQANISDHLAEVQVQLNDGQYELRWSREHQPIGEHGYKVLHLIKVTPYAGKPFIVKAEVTVDRKDGLRLTGQLTVDEKRKLVDLMFERVGGTRYRRAIDDDQRPLKSAALRLQVNSLRGKQLWNGVHVLSSEGNQIKYDGKVTYADLVRGGSAQQLKNEYTLKYDNSDPDNMLQYELDGKLTSSAYSALNFKYNQKLIYKRATHLEHELRLQPDGSGDENQIKISHVSKLINFDQPLQMKEPRELSMDHLLRVLIGPLNINREYTYTGKYKLNKHAHLPIQVDDQLTAQDLAPAKQLLKASYKIVADPANDKQIKLEAHVDCHDHGRLDYDEQIEIDDTSVHSKIVVGLAGPGEATSRKYTGEYRANEPKLWPSQFEFDIKRESDGKRVLHMQRDFVKFHDQHLKVFTRATLLDKTLYDLSVDYQRASHEGELDFVLGYVGHLRYSRRLHGDTDVRRWAYLSKCGHFFNGNSTKEERARDFQVELRRLNKPIESLNSKSIDTALASTDFKSLGSIQVQVASTKRLRRITDIESGHLLLQCPSYKLHLKREQSQGQSNTKFEIENLIKQRKLMIMASRDQKRLLAVMFKYDEQMKEKLAGDLTISLDSPTVLNLKGSNALLYVNFDPLRTKATPTEWSVVALQLNVKPKQYKHISTFKVLSPEDRDSNLYVLNSKSEGVSQSDQTPFERTAVISGTRDLNVFKVDVVLQHGSQKDQLYWEHELKKVNNEHILVHQVRVQSRNELVFAHKFDSKVKQDSTQMEMTFKSQLDGQSAHLKGAGLEFHLTHSLISVDTKGNLAIAYPYKGRSYSLQLLRRGDYRTDKEWIRQLHSQLIDKKLDYKDSLQVNLESAKKEFLAKYERKSLSGHALEHLELHIKADTDQMLFKLLAPRGWKAEAQYDHVSSSGHKIHVLLQKRGRLLVALDSDIQIESINRQRRSLMGNQKSLKIHSIFGWNGNAKFMEENLLVDHSGFKYDLQGKDLFTMEPLKVNLHVQQSSDGRKLNVMWKRCLSGDRCCSIEFDRTQNDQGAKGTLKVKSNRAAKPIEGQFELERVNGKDGSFKVTINGELNSQKVSGELETLSHGQRMELKMQLPKRLIVFSRERKSVHVVQYNFWPNQAADPAHVHTLELEHKLNWKPNVFRQENDHSWSAKLTNPALKAPVQLALKWQTKDKDDGLLMKADLSLDYSADAGKRLTYTWLMDQFKGGNVIRHELRTGDGKLNAKWETHTKVEVLDKNGKLTSETRHDYYWTNVEGKEMKGTDLTNFLYRTREEPGQESIWYKSAANAWFVYEWSAGIRKTFIAGQPSGWFEFSDLAHPLERYEFAYEDNNCVQLLRFHPPNRSVFNRLRACLAGARNQTIAQMEVVQVKKAAGKTEDHLIVRLERAEDKDLRFLLHWDPEVPGVLIAAISEQIDRDMNELERVNKIMSQEATAKWRMISTDFYNEVIQPLHDHAFQEANEIRAELDLPLLIRSRRSVADDSQDNLDDDQSPKSLRELFADLFHVRVIKYEPQQGEIEILFRPHPSASGSRKLVRQIVHNLLN